MLKKIIGINLLVFLVYALSISTSSAAADKGFNIAVGMGICVVIQVAINMVAGISFLVFGKREPGRALLISAAALIPIGFCTWLILLSIFG